MPHSLAGHQPTTSIAQAGQNPLGPYTVSLVSRIPPIPFPDLLPVPATAVLLHLGDALQCTALTHSGYDDTALDVMAGIADLLESNQQVALPNPCAGQFLSL